MKDSIFDGREEFMVSPLGGIPQLRKAHFLKPIASSIEGPNLKLPSLPFSSESEWPLKVSFNGCRHHQNKWKKWVAAMESVHHSVWKAAGIYEAIMGSVYKVHTDKDLIFGLVERWCCDTNTFLFPWGEATVTLEDMMILGGFSVLGDPVFLPLQYRELVQIEENLEKARRDLIGLKADNHTRWLNFFMNSGRDYEHEAFLSLWLSRFVFPGNEYDKIGTHVFPIAVNLARGTLLALAPAVLASIYRDLSLLKQTMIMASSKVPSRNRDRFDILEISLWAPQFFVQVWAWERLVALQPEQAQNNNMVSGVRIGRWHNVKQSGVINVRNTIDSSGETFQWRPYTLAVEGWLVPRFYKEKEEWTVVEGQNLDQEMESFVRCLRASELVGLDCQEPYRPNRVAMQFGYDQDFPKWIPRSPSSPELAWYNYSRPTDSDFRLYYPSRLFEPDVTIQYLKWWRKEILFLADALKGFSHGRRSKRRSKRLCNLYDSPAFAPKLKQVKLETDWDVCDVLPGIRTDCQPKQVENYPAAPPGFLNYPAVPPGFPNYPTAPPGFPNYPAVPPGFPNYPAVPPGFPPKCCGKNDKKNLSIGVSQTMACDSVPCRSTQKHIAKKTVYTFTDYAHESNGSSIVVPPKCNGENDKENISVGVCQTVACDVVPPGSMEKHKAGESVYTSTDAHDSNDSSSVVLPKCVLEYDKENLYVVPPGLTEKHNAGQSVYTSTDAHDSNESSSVVPPKCNRENDKENLSMEVSQTVACDAVAPSSTERHAGWEDDRNESNRNIARDLVNKCDDLITDIELKLSELERQVALHRRC
ncbi:uncharacterized protein LOC129891827 [Solanum dulcamara]|uniref:uncharacterized protein LOC129891827 n=1 Tax=Solanum dulcamara TaxID=45834 RepID=UPI002486454B|nr:uncharacterized protein LOC129891827 [Solanum dulcamara]